MVALLSRPVLQLPHDFRQDFISLTQAPVHPRHDTQEAHRSDYGELFVIQNVFTVVVETNHGLGNDSNRRPREKQPGCALRMEAVPLGGCR